MKLDVTTSNGRIIASALRGPDVDFYMAKYIFTARIRHLVEVHPGTCLVRRTPFSQENIDSFTDWIGNALRGHTGMLGYIHYMGHCIDALWVLEERELYNAACLVRKYMHGDPDVSVDNIRAALTKAMKYEQTTQ